jgi:hypothetical protein
MLAFAAFAEPNAEPSELQMERPFGEFFAKVEAKPLSEIQIIAFKKHSCHETGTPGYYCSFTYSTKAPGGAVFSSSGRGHSLWHVLLR